MPRFREAILATARVVYATSLLVGCARPSQTPCASVGHCPEGWECLANRCAPLGDEPVSAATRRLVLEPTRMAVVSERGDTTPASLPSTVTFGSGALGATALYLDFPPDWSGATSIERAFLLLEPADGAHPGAPDVYVEAWRITDDWATDALDWLDQPDVAPPTSKGIARATPPQPLRIEVTELIRYFDAHPHLAHGIAVTARDGNTHGASFATGTSGGRTPRLEIYVR